jgi:8-oxo-dGTP pyrophosphatase MutT (NUDIX family)
MTAQTESYLNTIDRLFNLYLSVYPQDAARLAVLSGQLKEGDEKLNDRKNMIGHLTASALVINKDDQFLLIYHRFLKRWLQPGGHLDQGEWPREGALRELLEETGLGNVTGPINFHPIKNATAGATEELSACPIDIDSHRIPPSSAKGEGEHLHHDFQYIFKLEQAGDIALDQGEVCDCKWVTLADLGSGDYGSRLKRVAEKIMASQTK